MRALKKVGVAVSLFFASAIAGQSFIDSVDFEGRSLHVAPDGDNPYGIMYGSKGDNDHKRWVCHASDVEINYEDGSYVCPNKFPDDEDGLPYREFTQVFSNREGTYTPFTGTGGQELTDMSMIGLIIGFGCTGVFILFSLINIIIDEVQRHADFEQRVEKAKDTLREDYNLDDRAMEEIEEEFRLKEAKGDKFDAEEERKELAAIN